MSGHVFAIVDWRTGTVAAGPFATVDEARRTLFDSYLDPERPGACGVVVVPAAWLVSTPGELAARREIAS